MFSIKKYDISNQMNPFVLMENFSWTVFLKKQRVMRHDHFYYVLTDVKSKTCGPSYFSSLVTVVYSLYSLSLSLSLSLSVCLYQTSSSIYLLKPPCLHETNFPYERGHSIAHSTFKTCVQRRKDYLGLFLNTNP